VKDIWTDTDEHGSVKMACIQTVKEYLYSIDLIDLFLVW
jgi:hypothetical protein